MFNFKVLFILGSSLLCHALTLILCLYFHYYEKDSLQIFVAAFYNALKSEKEALVDCRQISFLTFSRPICSANQQTGCYDVNIGREKVNHDGEFCEK